jgi:hypothetical protein
MSETGAADSSMPKTISPDAGVAGPLVLVDISGYTTYVAETELTHSQILVAELLDAVLESLGAPTWKFPVSRGMRCSSSVTRPDRS